MLATGFGLLIAGFFDVVDLGLAVFGLAPVVFGLADAFAFLSDDLDFDAVDLDLLSLGFGFVSFGLGLVAAVFPFADVVFGFVVCENAAIAVRHTNARTTVESLTNRTRNFIICPKSYHEIAFCYRRPYPRCMTELDQIWSKMLIDAGQRARDTGSQEIAEYLRLKATNDAIRTAGVGWLFDTVLEIAGREMGRRHGVGIEREEPHRFDRGNSKMVGSVIRINHGVRCMTVEAGWARTPSDGIMRNGALAFARIAHFGMPKDGIDMRFVRSDPTPQWLDEDGGVVGSATIANHIDKLFDR